MSKNYPKSPVGNAQSYAGLLALELSLHLPFPISQWVNNKTLFARFAIRHSGGTAQAHPVSLLVLKMLSKHMTILIFLIDNIHQIQKIVNPVCEKYICFKREI